MENEMYGSEFNKWLFASRLKRVNIAAPMASEKELNCELLLHICIARWDGGTCTLGAGESLEHQASEEYI